jgi:hypothetical protein
MPNGMKSSILHQIAEMRFYTLDPIVMADRNDSSNIYPTVMWGSIFTPINEHIGDCEYFNGISIASDPRELMHGDRRIRKEPLILRCSCGEEWFLPGELWNFQFKGMHMEEMIMAVNNEFFQSTRGNVREKVKREIYQNKRNENMETKDKLSLARSKVKSLLARIEV